MRLDKALQNIVYKLVPGLHTEEMERRKKFQEKNEPTKVPKEELEKHFFFCNDKISMSLEYYDTEKSKNNNDESKNNNDEPKNNNDESKNNNDESKKENDVNSDDKVANPNRRYLACPGTYLPILYFFTI